MGFGQRANRFKELGKIKSIRPTSDSPLTGIEAYTITSTVQPPSVLHARDPIFKPGSEEALDTNATFFEATESYGQDGVPEFTQYVINGAVPTTPVSQYTEYFTVTTTGLMSTQGAYASASNSGAAVRAPLALTQPSTFRKKGLVEVFLTESNQTDAEVAFSDDGVNWCSISFVNFFTDFDEKTATTSASFRNFSKYLNSSGTTDTAFVEVLGKYQSIAHSFGQGSLTYNTNGIFRSKVVPFLRKENETQMYLKTNVSFTEASVNATTTELGTISPLGFSEYTIGDDPEYTITPDSGSGIVSISVDGGPSETILDPEAVQYYTFTDISGSRSIEAVFGNQLTVTTNDSSHITSPADITKVFVRNNGTVTFTFEETPDSITFNSVAQTFTGTTFTTPAMVSPATINIQFSS